MRIRKAIEQDISFIVEMLADDVLGSQRENLNDNVFKDYVNAFEIIDNDVNQELVVVENDKDEIIGTLQLTFIQYLTYGGGIRAQIEAVRIRRDYREKGIGKKMIVWAIKRAKDRKAHVLQLTTDKQRPKAIMFYEELGFISSHEGMKMHF